MPDTSDVGAAQQTRRRALARARLEAKVAARRLKLALSAAEAGVYEIDHTTGAFWSSPELKRLAGDCTDYEQVRTLQFPRFHPEDLDSVREAFVAIQKGERSPSEGFEARIFNPDGEERWVRIFHHSKSSKAGRWLTGVGLVQDIDKRRRNKLALIEAERAAQAAAEAKSSFLANMSHEIRTPMNGVIGLLHLLKTENLSDEGRRLLAEALACGQMLSELLNDVIDFSTIEAGRLELACEPTDPAAVVESVVRMLRGQAQAKGLQLSLHVVDHLGWIDIDPVRLRQALFNMVGNAVKFTNQGRVDVRVQRVSRGGWPSLRFEVEDTGVGIPGEVQKRIFQRFDQGDGSSTRAYGGSGLGLAITKRLAEMMGGDVGFTSTEGAGSTFWMEVAAEPVEPVTAKDNDIDPFLHGLQILVVEDNPTNRLIATRLLTNLGATVETAADGLLGVEAARRGVFDLILMDVQMPGIDGPEAARRIRAMGEPCAHTPIIALTANVLAHQRRAYMEAGMNGVVGKPMSPAALLAEISRVSSGEASEAA
ncbi:MAG TPA: ATP-binding protein [Phenylobacterium sp.]